jgi:ribosome maturation protein Sdo1
MANWSVRPTVSCMWRSGINGFYSETNLDDVMQISNVFVNVSKGEVAKSGDLQKAFGTNKVNDIVAEVRAVPSSQCHTVRSRIVQILKKGEVQIGEKERDRDLTTLRKEIATLISEKCVDPSTQLPHPVGMIEKAMSEAGFSVKQNKTAKSQVHTHIPSTLHFPPCGWYLFTSMLSYTSGLRVHQITSNGIQTPDSTCPHAPACDYASRRRRTAARLGA